MDAPAAAARIAWLRLIRSENVGPHTFWQLLARFGSADAALDALPELARRAGRKRPLKAGSKREAEDEIEKIETFGAKLVLHGAPDYPALLAAIDAPPPVLTVLGDSGIAGPRTVGIVGARNASAAGRKMAGLLARDLGHHGVTIASGLARGVDTAAHRDSVATGTVAVMAGGIDVIYPRENAGLHAEIAERGAVVTEMPFGAEPLARHFPRRNRLISGMSQAVVVVEAAKRSGSLITARFALEQGREVLAVPGSPLDARAQGTNGLIRDGATLVQSAEDVLEAIESQFAEPPPPLLPPEKGAPPAPGGDAYARVEELLGPSPIDQDDLVRMSGLTPAMVASVLMELELAGRAIRSPGGRVAALPDDKT